MFIPFGARYYLVPFPIYLSKMRSRLWRLHIKIHRFLKWLVLFMCSSRVFSQILKDFNSSFRAFCISSYPSQTDILYEDWALVSGFLHLLDCSKITCLVPALPLEVCFLINSFSFHVLQLTVRFQSTDQFRVKSVSRSYFYRTQTSMFGLLVFCEDQNTQLLEP